MSRCSQARYMYREQYTSTSPQQKQTPSLSRPPPTQTGPSSIITQFDANYPEHHHAAAIDFTSDAPRRSHGAVRRLSNERGGFCFLTSACSMSISANALHNDLFVPVTAVFRNFPEVERTDHIRAVKAAVRVPVFANGNILLSSDIARCLAKTGTEAVMPTEGVLDNAALFHGLPSSSPLPSPSSAIQAPTLPLMQTNPPAHPPHARIPRARPGVTQPHVPKDSQRPPVQNSPPRARAAPYWDLHERLGRVQVCALRHLAGAGTGAA
ncbi:hypothetical protein D9615_009390 [Tricholomella constricta]|uniref:DUS-like FMN-binding domain-containing protein n=1 Tax=Tricholomella constricta TaxID=117010 RepID=A0A8H5H2U2_9AGAR|nr:hypothetical protein D9615_009390 [Tricholomella constricta]